jgi:hypothetical protein
VDHLAWFTLGVQKLKHAQICRCGHRYLWQWQSTNFWSLDCILYTPMSHLWHEVRKFVVVFVWDYSKSKLSILTWVLVSKIKKFQIIGVMGWSNFGINWLTWNAPLFGEIWNSWPSALHHPLDRPTLLINLPPLLQPASH